MPRIAAFGEVMMRLQVPGVETLAQSSRLEYFFGQRGECNGGARQIRP